MAMPFSASTLHHADFVIIGGGTSGLVVANRLTEDPNVTVLVLEAGTNHEDDPKINIPALWPSILLSEVDWAFVTTPQKHCNNRVIRHPQGKVLGGSSAINAQAFIFPSRAEFDAWEGKFHNPGWSWKAMAPYFRRFHTLTLPSDDVRKHLGIDWVEEGARATSGPIQASFCGVPQDILSKAWVDTFKAINYRLKGDPFAGQGVGGYCSPATIDPIEKQRSYAAPAYFAPVRDRPNLKVVTGVFVNKINIDPSGHATGVEVLVDSNTRYTVDVAKEVILAAGVFQTPKLLELSGIGDKQRLQSLGIPVSVSNPNVGENLQDHVMSAISFEVKEGVPTGDPLLRQEPEALQAAMQMYAEDKVGPLCVGGYATHSFMPVIEWLTDEGKHELERILKETFSDPTDLEAFEFVREILFNPNEGSGNLGMYEAQVNLHTGPNKSYLSDPQPGGFTSIGPILPYPLSRGSTHIVSSDPRQPPEIDPRYLSHRLDLELMARHLRQCDTVANTQPFASFLKPNGRRNHPSARGIQDLEKAKAYIRETAFSSNHPVGTCPMKPRNKGGVVDPELLVYGTKNIRVVDASMIPLLPRANTMSTVYAVAEKAADIIKSHYR